MNLKHKKLENPKYTKIFRHQDPIGRSASKKPTNSKNSKNRSKNGNNTSAIVSDDSAIGVDESFDFSGGDINTFNQLSTNHTSSTHKNDPLALSVNFLPFRIVKAQFSSEVPHFLRRHVSLLNTFAGSPCSGSIFRRRRYNSTEQVPIETEFDSPLPKFNQSSIEKHESSGRKLAKQPTESEIQHFIKQKVNEELAKEHHRRVHEQRRSFDNSSNSIDGKPKKVGRKHLPKSLSSIAFTFAPSTTTIPTHKSAQNQQPNLAQKQQLESQRLRSQSTSATALTKPARLRKTLSPVPERRRKLRQSYSTTLQPTTTKKGQQQSYTASTTSSSLKRYDAAPIKSRSFSPLLVRRRQSPSQQTAQKRRQLFRSTASTDTASNSSKQTSSTRSKRNNSVRRVKRSEKAVQVSSESPSLKAEPKLQDFDFNTKPELKSENKEELELKSPISEPKSEEKLELKSPESVKSKSTVQQEERLEDRRESTASTKLVEDEQSPSKSPTESRNSATKSPVVDIRKQFLFRALFADSFDEFEEEREETPKQPVVEACDLDGNCIIMTLNRDGSVCAPGATMLEDGEVVQLNVGGSRYTTTRSTLISREPDAFFAQLLQIEEVSDLPEPWRSAACRLDTGAYFIDRDGDLFAYVLDYLRNGKLLLPDNFKEIARLREETLFYQLDGMHQQILPYFSIRYPTKNGTSYTNGTGVTSALETGGFITLGYRGTFAFGRDGQADVKFRKLHRILVCGKAQLCREVFGETLNESRDPDREGIERYTSRLYLKHQCLERACDNLAEKGFKLVTACSSGANGLASNSMNSQGTTGSQPSSLRLVLAAPQQWKTNLTRRSPDMSSTRSAALNIMTAFSSNGNNNRPSKEFMTQRNSGDFEEQRWAHYTEYVFYREPQVYPSTSPMSTPRN